MPSTEQTMTESVPVDAICTDTGTQPRASICKKTVAEYALDLAAGAIFPPVDVFLDSTDGVYWLADGYHRLFAHRKAGRENINAILHQGRKADAQWFSYAANRDQDRVGLRRTNADKERAVRAALSHPNGTELSNGVIAEHVGVSERTVARYRDKLTSTMSKSSTRTCRDGRTISVANIGKRAAAGSSIAANDGHGEDSEATTAAPTDPPAPMSAVPTPVTPAAKPTPQPKDRLGRPIESEDVALAFENRAAFTSLMNEVSSLKAKFTALAERPGGQWAARSAQEFEGLVADLRRVLRFTTPYAVCPFCGGMKCAQCKESGWLPEEVFKALPADIKGGGR